MAYNVSASAGVVAYRYTVTLGSANGTGTLAFAFTNSASAPGANEWPGYMVLPSSEQIFDHLAGGTFLWLKSIAGSPVPAGQFCPER